MGKMNEKTSQNLWFTCFLNDNDSNNTGIMVFQQLPDGRWAASKAFKTVEFVKKSRKKSLSLILPGHKCGNCKISK